MKWCEKHWRALRAQVARKGLDGFVQQDSKPAADAGKQFSGADEPGAEDEDYFDPLMGSYIRINRQAFSQFGGVVGLMGRCPLCILVEQRVPQLVDAWLDGATNQALAHARETGRVVLQ